LSFPVFCLLDGLFGKKDNDHDNDHDKHDKHDFNVFAFCLGFCYMFLGLHGLDHETMCAWINAHLPAGVAFILTDVHAGHVIICFALICAALWYNKTTYGAISWAYGHLVEFVWIIIRVILMLKYTTWRKLTGTAKTICNLLIFCAYMFLFYFMLTAPCAYAHGVYAVINGYIFAFLLMSFLYWIGNLVWNWYNSMAIIRNHVYAYPVPSNISYLWCFGLTLMIIFILRIITGVCLVSEPMMGVGSILFHMIMSNMGRIAPGLHAIGSTMVMGVLFMHMLR